MADEEFNFSIKNSLIKRPKIAVIFLGRKGGGPIYSYEMAKGLIENGCEVYLFVSKYVDNLQDWLSLKTIKTEVIKTYTGKFSFVLNSLFFRLFKYRFLKRTYKRICVNACYIPMGHPWDCYIVNALKNPQKIITIHDPIEHSSNNSNSSTLARVTSILNKGIYDKKPDDIVILSKVFLEYVSSQKKVDKNHIHVIPHCVFSYYSEISTINSYDYDVSKINFLFFGRIDKYKGLDVLAKAFSLFLEHDNNSTLTIVGSGDFSFYLEKYENIKNVTVINRWIKDKEVSSFFVKDKNVILVLPYIDATQSGVIPIAMSSMIPIIASRTGGLVEQIEDYKTGFLVEPNNPQLLFQKMLEVSKRDNEQIIKNAKEYISHFSGVELSKKIINIIDKE